MCAPNSPVGQDSPSPLSFSRAAPPEEGLAAFNAFVTALRGEGLSCPTGEFGAHMRVSLVNDGPATFSLHLRADGAGAD